MRESFDWKSTLDRKPINECQELTHRNSRPVFFNQAWSVISANWRLRLFVAVWIIPQRASMTGLLRDCACTNSSKTRICARVRRVLSLLRSLAPATLLDIGSGRGTFLWPLLAGFPEVFVTAIDVLDQRIADLNAVRQGGIHRLQVVQMDVCELTFPDTSFDGVTILEVLEHLHSPEVALRQALRVARRFVIASVPSTPDDNPEHRHLFTVGRIERDGSCRRLRTTKDRARAQSPHPYLHQAMKPILKYPRTPHLLGSRQQRGDEDLAIVSPADLKGCFLIVEEKLDGANTAISFDDDWELVLQSRGHVLSGGPRERQFDLFKRWANAHRDALSHVLGNRYVLYGEWLYARHTIRYDCLPHYFLEFDLFDRDTGSIPEYPATSPAPFFHSGCFGSRTRPGPLEPF